MIQAKKQGITFEQAKKAIIAQGGSEDEIKVLTNLWNRKDLTKNNTISTIPETLESNIGLIERSDDISFQNNNSRFASEFFNNKDISETPQLFLATPQDYRLGPGDELIINIFGSTESSFLTEISREGNIKLEGFPPCIYLA